jgi:hypothetical protein
MLGKYAGSLMRSCGVTIEERIGELLEKAPALTHIQLARLQLLLWSSQRQLMSIREGSKPRPRRTVGSTMTDSASTLMMVRRRDSDSDAHVAAKSTPPMPARTVERIRSA